MQADEMPSSVAVARRKGISTASRFESLRLRLRRSRLQARGFDRSRWDQRSGGWRGIRRQCGPAGVDHELLDVVALQAGALVDVEEHQRDRIDGHYEDPDEKARGQIRHLNEIEGRQVRVVSKSLQRTQPEDDIDGDGQTQTEGDGQDKDEQEQDKDAASGALAEGQALWFSATLIG